MFELTPIIKPSGGAKHVREEEEEKSPMSSTISQIRHATYLLVDEESAWDRELEGEGVVVRVLAVRGRRPIQREVTQFLPPHSWGRTRDHTIFLLA